MNTHTKRHTCVVCVFTHHEVTEVAEGFSPKLKALVNDIFPPTTAVAGYAVGLPKLSTDNVSLVLQRQPFCNHKDNSNYTGPHFSHNHSVFTGMLQCYVACTVCVCVCVLYALNLKNEYM